MTQYPSLENKKSLSIINLQKMKQKGEKIACLTAYDASFTAVLDQAGIDLILVGDSLGMVIQGKDTTLPVTVDDIVYHTQCVTRARQRAFIVADLPFMSYSTPEAAVENAARLMQQGLAQMVKLEGTKPDIIAFLVAQGIPVCGHLGLLPQSINQLGGYLVQGKEKSTADKILSDSLTLEQAGASLLVLECVPAVLAKNIASQLHIPVIGIGAGIDCDGQVLVLYDMLDISVSHRPRFSKNYLQNASSIAGAVSHYIEEVKQQRFPSSEHTYQ
jgi:3-methyl-2-oxobutanoate hydroxymethyltransferase